MSRRAHSKSVVCPQPSHVGSRVNAYGLRKGKNRTTRRFRCQPVGKPVHYFSVVTDVNGQLPDTVVVDRVPECSEHVGSKVIRKGLYPSKKKADATGVKRRQRYRCYPTDDDSCHDFTPPLPRLAVEYGHEHCPSCNELTSVHHGAQSSARKHQSLLTIVVDALASVAEGTPYSRASVVARRRLGAYSKRTPKDPDPTAPAKRVRARKRPKPEGTPKRESSAAKTARAHWHLAADWTEIYAPVCYQQVLKQMREVEQTQARHPDPLRPRVLLLDALSAQSKRGRTVSRKMWHVLAAAQVVWDDTNPALNHTRLRQLRAMPAENTVAWRLFLDELAPYEPDYVVADLGKAQVAAVKATFPNAVIIPSLFHLLTNLEKDLSATAGTRERNRNNVYEFKTEVKDHLRTMRGSDLVTMNYQQWTAWWDDLADTLTKLGCDPSLVRKRQKLVDRDISLLLPHLNALPSLPLSTGGLELLLSDRVKPLFKRREHVFANLERTNLLLDLVVCKDRGLFDDRADVVALIRKDNEKSGGWSLAPRTVNDRMPIDPVTGELLPVSSLSDYSIVQALALKKALI